MAPGRKQPIHLRGASTRKGKKYTTAQLAAKKQRVELTLKQKCDVIDQALKSGFQPNSVESTLVRVNQTMLAKQYNVTVKTINRVLWSAKKLKQQLLTTSGDLRRNREIKYRAIEEKVVAFVSLLRNRRKPMPISLSIIKVYAEQVAKSLGEHEFKASNGWWQKLLKRNSIGKSVRLHGEAGDVNPEDIKERIQEIKKMLEEYDPELIYNWDETGLYFRLIPSATYTAPNEQRRRTRGTKAQKAKDRVTLITCTNAIGTHKIPLAMIGKAAQPRCFRTSPSPLPYNSQKNAWNDHVLTKWWFHDVFLPAIRKRTSRPVILIADNFGSHDETDAALQDPQVKWVLLPPNCTSVHQPMDQGIIAAIKRKYKSNMLHSMVKNLERYDELRTIGASITAGVGGLNHAYPPNLLDAATIAHEVWESMNQSTLLNCWLKADILPTCHVEGLETYRRPLSLPAVEELSSLLQHATISSQPSSQDDNDQPPPAIGREHFIGEFVALQWQAKNDPAGLVDVLNDWFDIEDGDLVKQDEVQMALEREDVQPTAGNDGATETPMEIDPSSVDIPPDPLSADDDSDSEVQPLTRMEALNSVNITEGIEMVEKVIQIMSSLDEDEATYMLTRVYRKCLDLKAEKKDLNSKQTVLREYFVPQLDTSCDV